MIVIADAGPLLHLFWVEASDWALPPQDIEVVETVRQEVAAYVPAALQDSRLRFISQPITVPEPLREQIDSGEAEAISYALAQPPGTELLVLCDDQRARRVCRNLLLPVIGSSGLIVEAYRAGRVSRDLAESALRDLPTRGRFYIKIGLISQAIAALDGT